MNKLFILLLSVCIGKQALAQPAQTMYGKATYYAESFNHKRTSSGEIFNMDSFTAASKNLPFGTLLKVTNLRNNKSVIVRVNDRCPAINHRLVDLSKAAAKSIDMIHSGVASVKVECIGPVQKDSFSFATAVALNLHKSRVKPRTYSNPVLSKTAYAVQIGSFKKKSNVDKLTASLSGKGFRNNKVRTQKDLYRVTVGPYASMQDANAALKKLKAFNFEGCVIKGDSYASL